MKPSAKLQTKAGHLPLATDPSAQVLAEPDAHLSSTRRIHTSRIGASEKGSTQKGTLHGEKFAMVNHIRASPSPSPISTLVPHGLFQDLAHLSLPPLMSPTAAVSSSLMSPSLKRPGVLPVKDGFECSNNVLERSMAQNAGLKHIQAMRAEVRRKEKPRFIIKALDPKEFLSTTIADVGAEDTTPYRKASRRPSSLRGQADGGPSSPGLQRHGPDGRSHGLTQDSARAGAGPQLTQTQGSQTLVTRQAGEAAGTAASGSAHSQKPRARDEIVRSYASCGQSMNKREFKQKSRQSEALKSVVNSMGIHDNKLLVFKGSLFPEIRRIIKERAQDDPEQARGRTVN